MPKTSSRKKVQQYTENYDTLLVGIEMSRKTLYTRINKRVDIMLGHGLFNEVKALVEQGFESSQKYAKQLVTKNLSLL